MIDPAGLLDIGKERWTCYKFSVNFDLRGQRERRYDETGVCLERKRYSYENYNVRGSGSR